MKRTSLAASAAALGLLASASSASAATTASGTQAVTGIPTAQLEATIPSTTIAFGAMTVAGSGNVSAEQTLNVKSNKDWGIRVATDQTAGKMRQHNGSSYVGSGYMLTNPLQLALTTNAGVAVGSPTYADLSSTQASVVSTQTRTSDSGTNMGMRFKQLVSYGDESTLPGSDTFRVVVTYDVQQGF